MKKIAFFLVFLFSLSFVSCGGDDDNNNDDPYAEVPDPADTITANISDGYTNSIIFSDRAYLGRLRWQKPNDIFFEIGGSYHDPADGYYYYYNASICNVGVVNGLGNIKSVPTSGWSTNNVACETGHGYVIRIKCYQRYKSGLGNEDYDGDVFYARIYIVEPIITTAGGIAGAKVKYEFPWNP